MSWGLYLTLGPPTPRRHRLSEDVFFLGIGRSRLGSGETPCIPALTRQAQKRCGPSRGSRIVVGKVRYQGKFTDSAKAASVAESGVSGPVFGSNKLISLEPDPLLERSRYLLLAPVFGSRLRILETDDVKSEGFALPGGLARPVLGRVVVFFDPLAVKVTERKIDLGHGMDLLGGLPDSLHGFHFIRLDSFLPLVNVSGPIPFAPRPESGPRLSSYTLNPKSHRFRPTSERYGDFACLHGATSFNPGRSDPFTNQANPKAHSMADSSQKMIWSSNEMEMLTPIRHAAITPPQTR